MPNVTLPKQYQSAKFHNYTHPPNHFPCTSSCNLLVRSVTLWTLLSLRFHWL